MTDPITRRTITCNEDLFEEGYDSDGDIGPFFDAFVDEEDIEYYTEEVIDTMVEFQGAMYNTAASTIEVVATDVEFEEPLTPEKVQKLKVEYLKVDAAVLYMAP